MDLIFSMFNTQVACKNLSSETNKITELYAVQFILISLLLYLAVISMKRVQSVKLHVLLRKINLIALLRCVYLTRVRFMSVWSS